VAVWHGKNPTEHVAVAAKVLGAGMHHHVGTLQERVLQRGRGKSRVHDEVCAPLMGFGCIGGHVHCFTRGVQWRLDVDDVPFVEVFGAAVEGEGFEPREACVDPNHTMGTVVAFSNGDVLRVEEDKQSMDGCKPRGVGNASAMKKS
jgi:hypothetical protein